MAIVNSRGDSRAVSFDMALNEHITSKEWTR